ncbi:hypothetical protein [Siminovitchia sp. 179-K 8D1 HS]|uniref:hypothetical protein n=1 Tax=Siminovitchia sp. 179-K 8D1 HS TaxID=3142385 RepID=UPI0039A24BFD
MINEQATMLNPKGTGRCKESSLGLGVITKDQKWVTGQICDDIGKPGLVIAFLK